MCGRIIWREPELYGNASTCSAACGAPAAVRETRVALSTFLAWPSRHDRVARGSLPYQAFGLWPVLQAACTMASAEPLAQVCQEPCRGSPIATGQWRCVKPTQSRLQVTQHWSFGRAIRQCLRDLPTAPPRRFTPASCCEPPQLRCLQWNLNFTALLPRPRPVIVSSALKPCQGCVLCTRSCPLQDHAAAT